MSGPVRRARAEPALSARAGTEEPLPRWVGAASALGLAGVSWYVASWAIAGAILPGYEPVHGAISELFALGAPTASRWLVGSGLVVSGVGLVAFAAAMDRGLPGRGRAGPALAAVAGVMTVLMPLVPCTEGCPGAGSSTLDTLHGVVAGIGYGTLILAPFFVAWRIRHHAPRLARWSVVLAGLALAGFLVRYLGTNVVAGLQQRAFNTIADLWYAVAAIYLIARVRGSR